MSLVSIILSWCADIVVDVRTLGFDFAGCRPVKVPIECGLRSGRAPGCGGLVAKALNEGQPTRCDHLRQPDMSLPLLFSTFKISGQVFYQSKLSLGLVNLKPLTPGRKYRRSGP